MHMFLENDLEMAIDDEDCGDMIVNVSDLTTGMSALSCTKLSKVL